MKTPGKLQIKPLMGIDERIPAMANTSILMQNFSYDAMTKCWHNFVGFEEFFHKITRPYPRSWIPSASVDSIYYYQRHNSAQQWLLYEQDGTLYYSDNIAGTFTGLIPQPLSTDRHIPAANECHTSYNPFGKYCVITNGIDGALKYRGGNRVFPLGWDYRPQSPDATRPLNLTTNPQTYVESTNNFQMGNNEIGGTTNFDTQSFQGVGSETKDDTNKYYYKVSFVNEAGSESPISEASSLVKWKTLEITKGTNAYTNTACVTLQIPVGPTGTIARRIYRTARNGSDFYFLDVIRNNSDDIYVDYKADTQLGALAPNDSDSIIMPAKGARFSSSFKNCLFLDGGIADGSRIYYSSPLQPDTFKDSAYFDVGTREGGDVTGFMVYYNSLLIFREKAIDLVRGDALNGFELVPFISGIGCNSPHTIVNVPTLGVVFLSKDGVYRIYGGLDGGADLNVVKVSDPIQQYIERMAFDKLPSAIGIYSSQWRELHFYISLDDGYQLDTGLVYHLDSDSWTIRDNTTYKIKCITTDKDASLIYGMFYEPGQVNKGIYVISYDRRAGTRQVGSGEGATYPDALPIVSKIRTQWIDFGEPFIKKNVKYVYLYIQTTGNQNIQCTFYKDRQWYDGISDSGKLMQRADHTLQPVYGEGSVPTQNNAGVWDTSKWQDKLLTQVRYAVDLQSVSEFAFEIETSEPIVLMGYAIEYTSKGAETIGGRT